MLEEVDITSAPASYDLYKDWIPVVTVDGIEIMRGIPNELALRRGPAKQAQRMYEETEASIAARKRLTEQLKAASAFNPQAG